jgi:hypothetical protein
MSNHLNTININSIEEEIDFIKHDEDYPYQCLYRVI